MNDRFSTLCMIQDLHRCNGGLSSQDSSSPLEVPLRKLEETKVAVDMKAARRNKTLLIVPEGLPEEVEVNNIVETMNDDAEKAEESKDTSKQLSVIEGDTA